ncbi:enhancer of mRNA decapping 4 [Porites harrisoni]
MSAPDPSSVPIPNFRSSPRGETSPQSSVKEPVVNSETEAVACSSVIQNLENGSSGSKGTALKDRSATGSPVGRQVDVEASVDDEAKDEGDEELPESQKPEAEIQEEINERERKSSSGSSTSESLRPLSARAAEGNLISLEDNVKGKEDDVQADGEDAFTDDRLMEQWEMNVDDEAVPTGRESPESAHALPVSTPVMPSARRKQPSIHTSFVSTPVSALDIPPQPIPGSSVDNSILSSIGELVSLVKTQQKDIQELQQRLDRYQTAQQQQMATVSNEVQMIEERVSGRLQRTLADFSKEESQRLDKALREKHSGDKKRQEQLQSTLSQVLTTTLSGKLDKAVKAEVKSSVVPTVQKVLNSIQEQLNTTLAQKLTAADTVLKESIAKMVKSKGVVDAIGGAAATALQGPIQVTYREAFQSTILPSFERACQNMFQQINESFHKGTQQYLQQVTTALDNRRREERESVSPVMQQLEAQTKSFQAMTERLSSNIMADFEVMLQKQLSSSIEGLREEIFSRLLSEVLASVQDSVQKEMGLGLEGLRQQLSEMIATSVESSTQQAPDLARTQVLVSQLLESGQLGQAFQEALTASDLNIVMYVCEQVDPESVFSQSPCPLSQPVLLSLIQQLSVDLTVNTELKHKYIEEALMSLDTTDEVTREHMPAVLEGLCKQLQSAIQEATGPMQRSLKMLQMAARSLLR